MNTETAAKPVAFVYSNGKQVGSIKGMRGEWVFNAGWDAPESIPSIIKAETTEELRTRLTELGLTIKDSELAADPVRTMLLLDAAAELEYRKLTPNERAAYIKVFPNSRFISTAASEVQEHLLHKGWVKKGKVWSHPVSKRQMTRKPSETHTYHAVVTHPNGSVTNHKTNSPQVMKRVINKMSKKPDNSGISNALKQGAGSLHQHFGIEHGTPIPLGHLQRLAKSDHPLSGRAQLVLNLKRARRRGPITYKAAT